MKKLKKITAALLSAVAAMSIIAGTAMAEDVSVDTLNGSKQDVLEMVYSTPDWEERLEELQKVNPNATIDAVAEMCWKLDNPEANGLVLVDTTEIKENGLRVVQSIYTDKANSDFDPIGQKTFSAVAWIYKDGIATNNNLLWKSYLHIDMAWDNTVPSVTVYDDTFTYWELKHTDSEYPVLAGDLHDCGTGKHNFEKCGWAYYTIYLKFENGEIKPYKNEIYVNSRGMVVEGGMDQEM